jgi:hypothetical protein
MRLLLFLVLALYVECLEMESINRVFETVEEVVANAESHWIRHSEAFEEVKVEFLLLLALIIIVIDLVMNLDLVGQGLLDILHAHAVRSEKSGLRHSTFLITKRKYAF